MSNIPFEIIIDGEKRIFGNNKQEAFSKAIGWIKANMPNETSLRFDNYIYFLKKDKPPLHIPTWHKEIDDWVKEFKIKQKLKNEK